VDHVGIKTMKTRTFHIDILCVELQWVFSEAWQDLEHLLTVI